MIPGHLLGEVFGDPGRRLGKLFEVAARLHPDPSADNPHQPDVAGDLLPIDPETIWEVKGPRAPSAIDFDRRPAVLDVMGIDRQMVFPTAAIGAIVVGSMTDAQFKDRWGGDASMLGEVSRPEFARRVVDAYNDWILDHPVQAEGRIRFAGIVPTSSDPNEMIDVAKKLVGGGVRAVYLQADQPPGGLSPANKAFDPLWELFEAENTTVTLHIGSEYSFVDPRWAFADAFADVFQSAELPNNDIKTFSTLHFAIDNYLKTLVLGGVFERFPRLRFGILEIAAHWFGSAVRSMDMWVEVFPGSSTAKLPMKPSEYVTRNVRISPFSFEPVDRYLQQDPFMADVLCYSSDYPHVEGGKNSLAVMHQKVDPFGEDVATKFFRTNAEWILP